MAATEGDRLGAGRPDSASPAGDEDAARDSEQAWLDHAYECLAEMRARTAAAVAAGDTAAQAVDGAIAHWHLRQRLKTLDTDVAGLAFGRIDEEHPTGAPAPRWYVGRRHVEDAAGEPVVVDWRAPVAVPFYRATAADPLGLALRRRFLMTDRRIDAVFDEVFDDPDSVHAARHGGIPDPLLAELDRARTGEMRDIVATIQAEQDLVIRAGMGTCLLVQGGPGTGKTAVGLHRAAFLLYEHRRLLDDQGVLVIGPNPLFLRYIAQVLPSLGETAVRQTTLVGLLGGRVRAFDPPAVAALKGDERMAAVLAAAVGAGRRPPEVGTTAEVATGWGTMRLAAGEVNAIMDEISARGVPHNVGRTALRTRIIRLLEQQLVQRRHLDAVPPGFAEELRTSRALSTLLDRWWPSMSAAAVVRRVLSSKTALARAAAGVLDAGEQAALLRKPTRRAEDEPWTEADLALVDEAVAALDGVPRVYGHVVVDEAQDLTAMELRALARRCPSRSMTVLGDLAQATRPGAQSSWDDVARVLGGTGGREAGGGGGQVQRVELDLGYRVPAPLLEYANRLLAVAAPHLRPTRSVRDQGEPPALHHAPEDLAGVLDAVVNVLVQEWASVGVIVPAGVAVNGEFGETVTVVRPSEAKGLEFDAVVVVEPSAIVAEAGAAAGEAGAGERLLYIALTRAVQAMAVVHSAPLPAVLAG